MLILHSLFQDIITPLPLALSLLCRALRLSKLNGRQLLHLQIDGRSSSYDVVASGYSHENDVICNAKYPPLGKGSGRRLYESQVPLQT
jgi:hypothetical protein